MDSDSHSRPPLKKKRAPSLGALFHFVLCILKDKRNLQRASFYTKNNIRLLKRKLAYLTTRSYPFGPFEFLPVLYHISAPFVKSPLKSWTGAQSERTGARNYSTVCALPFWERCTQFGVVSLFWERRTLVRHSFFKPKRNFAQSTQLSLIHISEPTRPY